MDTPVVAGLDGSAASPRCVAWAANEARLRGRPLELVHASMLLYRDGSLSEAAYEGLEEERTRLLVEAKAYALGLQPGLEVRTRLLAQEPGKALVFESERAELIVVGTSRLEAFGGPILGAVALRLVTGARCPVLAVTDSAPDADAAPAEIVVGVAERGRESRAIGWAFEEAALRGAHLNAVHALGGEFAGRAKAEEDALLAEALAGWRSKYPDVEVSRTISDQHPARALVTASDEAALVVVGATHRPGITEHALGTVGHALLHQALSAVVIVPET
ncbi:universal stress protein [Actinomadura sp. NBRC 104425]|uniref:universal stress protein n=1 Tax=Actinomadura sp. NBRC 104425 TaxID=3032204 RepID=UPI0024A042F7|nr:universal stress protein [Actinomadura sp. NBRC 104425]GLZ11879.1 universal stress protein [Actinomadura sp. NBRC 104425]